MELLSIHGWNITIGGTCLRIGTYRISVRFLMALVQWCSGYVSFLERRADSVALDIDQ